MMIFHASLSADAAISRWLGLARAITPQPHGLPTAIALVEINLLNTAMEDIARAAITTTAAF